ncbi:toxin glutamine deamidase domain-containing protein [Phytohabitans flavus]|uniref:toxin glutamine deamidase domain-containing protein n=1 Tax=Phytohabitans flavus TaxID=1076124 RepID=UPI00362FCF3F
MRATDDSAVGLGGTAGARALLAAGPGWHRAAGHQAIEAAVRQAGVGASALVLIRRPGQSGRDPRGHAMVLHHTTDGLVWVDPLADPEHPRARVTEAESTPELIRRAVDIDATIVGPDGRIRPPDPDWARDESASTVSALVEAPRSTAYGYGGDEEELYTYFFVLDNHRGEALPYLAEHQRLGLEATADHGDFATAGGEMYAIGGHQEPAGARSVNREILELKAKVPLPVLPFEQDKLGRSPEMVRAEMKAVHLRLERLFAPLSDRPLRQRRVRMSDVFRQEDGWRLHPQAQTGWIYSARSDRPLISPQTTVGVALVGMHTFIADMAAQRPLPTKFREEARRCTGGWATVAPWSLPPGQSRHCWDDT